DDMQPFNVLKNTHFQDILYEIDSRVSFPGKDIFKQKLHQAVNYLENCLKNLINDTLETCAFTTDLWTKAHKPYIGITIYWLTSEFEMHKILLTIESFSYPHTSEHIEDYLHLLGIQELVELLGLFAHVTTIMGRDHYPTLSMMLPLIKVLQEHLFRKAHTLTNPIIRKPGLEGYITVMLDSRFKDLSFESEKFETTKNKLRHRIKKDMRNIYPTTYASENHVPSLLNSLFEEAPRQVCPVETELKVYFDMPKMPKHDLSDPLYKKHNPL
ncbi:13219_t:CDS:2, partial [Ambispora gerdemannii]